MQGFGNKMIYRRFKLDKKVYLNLSEEDKKVLSILEGVVRDLAKVYELQLKDGFYPKNITKKDLEETGKQNPEILSPFTIVYKKNGQLEAIPYHQKYSEYLLPISKKIEKAAQVCKNKSFKDYLKARARSLKDGSYREADIAWLNVKNSNIDFSIGPFERYLDKILFIKRAFQAHVGIIDQKKTLLAKQIEETLYISARLSFGKYHSTDIPRKGVSVLVEWTPKTSGYMSDVVFSGEHFPCDLDIMEQYGSKILIYESQLKLKFERLHYPIFKSIFEKKFASKYSKELLLRATGWRTLLNELTRQLHKFKGSRERLQELFGIIDEANGFASGIQHSKHLVTKGVISQEELEAIIIVNIVWMFSDWLLYKQNKGIRNHALGNSILLNFYLATGALRESAGFSWPNFYKMFFENELLADTLSRLLQDGSYNEAEQFMKKYANLSNFERLGRNLKGLTPKL